ncbi:unnamed protein product [Rotaria sp. Silwood2]|nr:unnamed protein product [Rotaria sp. Silwood2]CAF2741965.1 unnamed protein product [Rotaria sp. Silwood2]CAF3193089.1 unnamed protein product [Rotaria sp. Silwood2]CAF4172078.1 unnamed protein product [Rotaria sp. Silwood2]CAF4225867.1 unnamed protein product [Rotaria sp. Silwood2]
MPISNNSSESRMTKTTIRLDPTEVQRRQQAQNTQRITTISKNNDQSQTANDQLQSTESYPYKTRTFANTDTSKISNTYPIVESPSLNRGSSPPIISRGSPRMFRVKRVSRAPQSSPPPLPAKSPEKEVTTKSVIIKDTISRGTTPPPTSFFDTFPKNQTVYYPTSYDMRRQQAVSTVRYRTPSPSIHPTTTTTSSEVIVQQQPQTNASTTTKTTTRILDAKTLPTLSDDSFIEETKTTTTIIKPIEIPTAPAVITSSVTTVPQPQLATTTTVVPAVATTTIRERPTYRTHRRRRIRTNSPSTLSTYTTSSTGSYTTRSYTTNSTITPRPHIIKQHTILPPRPPIQTTIINDPPTTIVPERRFIHHARRTRTHSGYYSSDLDFGKRKVYKSDYKYRHYYYCNWCKGRCDLPNSSCSCCEWFYGCPLWALILLGLLLFALIVTFFTLLGLQPTINSARRSQTAETKLLNRTQIIYGYLQNCGYQANAPTTLVLCSNTGTTSTSRIELSSYYMTSKTKYSGNFADKPFYISYLFRQNKFVVDKNDRAYLL